MRIWVRYARQDSAMRAVYRGMRRRAQELGGLEVRLWAPANPSFLLHGGWRPDGMILIGRSSKAEADQRALGVPALHIDLTLYSRQHEEPPRDWPSCGLDEAATGRLAAEHLASLGLQRLCLLNQGWSGPQGPRSRAFIDRAGELGCTVTDICSACGYRAFDESDPPGPRRMINFLKQLPRPFGIYATSDPLAELAVDYCHMAGLDVPRDVGVLGTGDDPLHAADASVPLSSIHQPFGQLGSRAMDRLATILDDRGHPAGPMAAARMKAKRGDPAPLGPLGVTMRQSTASTYATDELVAEAVALIAADRDCKLTVDGLAQQLGVSSATLFRRCRAAWDCSPSRYLARARIRRAQRLLRDQPQIPLTRVAQTCGFSDQAAFTRAFRRLCGCTPGAYRQG